MNNTNNTPAPILFLIFNRPETTEQVFAKIRIIKPKQLFVAADGPRPDHPDDVATCNVTRKIIDTIDWDCELKTLFLNENLGCGKSVSNAITWFFSHVEEGIILEDDCIPDLTFFDFCHSMLARYRNNESIMMISGTSFLFNNVKSSQTYFFAKYYSIWGWATWRRAWQHYDFELKSWSSDEKGLLQRFFKNRFIVDFWIRYFNRIATKSLDTWDIQWTYACIKKQGLAIVPYNNLVENIGYFGAHSNGKKGIYHQMPIKAINGVIYHPPAVISNETLNKKIYMNLHIIPPFSIKAYIKKMLWFLTRKNNFSK